MPLAVEVDVQIATELSNVPAEPEIRRWLERVVGEVGGASARQAEVSLRVVDEAESRELNKRYRNRDTATNVLSFPLDDAGIKNLPADWPLCLGDIVICGPVVDREAAEQGKETADHWAHLLVHGALHLFGYDHQTDGEAREMEALEARILALGGVENPYKTQD